MSDLTSGAPNRDVSGPLLNCLLGLLSWLVPTHRGQIVLGALRGKHFRGNPKYRYLYLLGAGERYFDKSLWVTECDAVLAELQARALPAVKLRSWRGFISVLRAKFLVFSHSVQDLPGPFSFDAKQLAER
jgi:hypothetical protein